MKKCLVILLTILAVVSLLLALTSCDILAGLLTKHEHSYGKDWKFDETNHWRVCSCGEKTDFAEHDVSEWTVNVPPTVSDDGSKTGNCAICGYKLTVVIPSLSSPQHVHEAVGEYKSNAYYHWQNCACGQEMNKSEHSSANWVVDVAPTTTSQGSMHKVCDACGITFEIVTTPMLTDEPRYVDFFALNDFHGSVDRMSSVAGYMHGQKVSNQNTVLLNSGDMFQGSMESNSNFGALLSQCMEATGFDSFTFGNHEFDWGLKNLKTLAKNSKVPFLGANIYNWNASTKTWGEFASDLAQEYVVKVLPNGLKVGIIGIIGKDQITSISSNLVQTIGFKDPAEIVPPLYNKLKNEQGCDVVVISAHTGQETFLNNATFDITQYADAVFCAHTHKAETAVKNGVPFIQGGGNGSNVSHITIKVDVDGTVSFTKQENIAYSKNWDNLVVVQEYIDNSNEKIKAEANQILANITGGYIGKNEGVGRLICHAMAEYATSQGYDIDLAISNQGRNSLQKGSVTYSNLYEAVPFDNQVYIAKVSGRDIINELKYAYMWRVSTTPIENNNSKYYTIAVLDYLLYHQNANRDFDYFPSAFRSGAEAPVPLTKTGGVELYNYRLMVKDFLLDKGTIDAQTYTTKNNHTDVDLITKSVTFAVVQDQFGTIAMFTLPQAVLPERRFAA